MKVISHVPAVEKVYITLNGDINAWMRKNAGIYYGTVLEEKTGDNLSKDFADAIHRD